jgi:hypothetical protein
MARDGVHQVASRERTRRFGTTGPKRLSVRDVSTLAMIVSLGAHSTIIIYPSRLKSILHYCLTQ